MVNQSLRNSSWLIFEKVTVMAMNLIVTLVLARQLGPEVFGQLSYVLAVITLVIPFSALGLNALIMRELVESPQHEQRVMTTALVLRGLGALVALLFICLWAYLLPSLAFQERLALVVIGAAASLQALQLVEHFFNAKVQIKYVVRLRTAVLLFSGVVKIAVAIYTQDMLLVACIFALEYLLWGIGYHWLYSKRGSGWRITEVSWKYGFGLLRQSWWLMLSGIAAAVYLKIDQVMLGQMVDKSTVGIYAIAVRISEVWYFFATAIAASFFSMLLKLRAEDPQGYQNQLQRLCDGLFISALVIAIGVTLVAPIAIPWLFGEDYAASATILMIHVWAGLFVFMRELASKWLLAERLLAFSLLSHGIGAIFNIGLNLYLIPRYQGEGAAIATVVSYASAAYFAFWLAPKTRPLARIMTRSLLLPVTLGYRYWTVLSASSTSSTKGKK
ncbi:flippase [Pseudidiomarina sp. E22-M8]|uniref:flippase n=1 Tax=Pseudidiomarina sp. E22-M8 TaxID=3424768 RepID=UPI00403C7C06